MKDDIRLFYDLTAERTAAEWYDNQVLEPLIRRFVAYLPERPLILDLGCGPGHESMRLHRHGAEVVGIDFSPECIRIARERCPECRFELFDFRRLDERWGKFHGIFAAGSLIHIGYDELPDLLVRLASVTKPGGYLMALLLEGEGIIEEKSSLQIGDRVLNRIVYGYSRERFQKMARGAKFEFSADCSAGDLFPGENWRAYLFRHLHEPGENELN